VLYVSNVGVVKLVELNVAQAPVWLAHAAPMKLMGLYAPETVEPAEPADDTGVVHWNCAPQVWHTNPNVSEAAVTGVDVLCDAGGPITAALHAVPSAALLQVPPLSVRDAVASDSVETDA
jgi:hypothetical protein